MIYVFLAHGFEEIEAITVVDILRRCDLEVTTVGIGSQYVTGSHHIAVKADVIEQEFRLDDNIEAIVLPGGMPGTLNLEKSPVVQQAIQYASAKRKLIAAICAAPSILGHKGLLEGKHAICFPGFEEQLFGAELCDSYVCEDGNIITAKSAGVAMDFAFAVAKRLLGNHEKTDKVAASLQRGTL